MSDPRSVMCPYCGAPGHSPCMDSKHQLAGPYCLERVQLARDVEAILTEAASQSTAPEDEECAYAAEVLRMLANRMAGKS
jgi:hypothetical protein